MSNGTGNIIVDKSKAFAIRIVQLYQFLSTDKKEYVLSKQLLKCGTIIGANVREGIYGQSKPDFHIKMTIALKKSQRNRILAGASLRDWILIS